MYRPEHPASSNATMAMYIILCFIILFFYCQKKGAGPVSRVLSCPIINLGSSSPTVSINLPPDNGRACPYLSVYLVFQPMRLAIVPVTVTRRGLLPRVFTLTQSLALTHRATVGRCLFCGAVCRCIVFGDFRLDGGRYSSPPLQRLPVRKHGGSCCPDFPPGLAARR